MSQHNETGIKTFTSSAALGQYLRVTDDGSGQMQLAGAGVKAIGTVQPDGVAFAADKPVTIITSNAPGTRKMVAAAAITAFAHVYAAAGGKVNAEGAICEGIALQAASGDGSVIEVLPIETTGGEVKSVTATGSAQGDAATLTGGINLVAGGDDTTGVVLPSAAAGVGPIYVYNNGSAGLKIYPNTSDTINGGSANAAVAILENTMAILVALDATNWGMVFTANS